MNPGPRMLIFGLALCALGGCEVITRDKAEKNKEREKGYQNIAIEVLLAYHWSNPPPCAPSVRAPVNSAGWAD